MSSYRAELKTKQKKRPCVITRDKLLDTRTFRFENLISTIVESRRLAVQVTEGNVRIAKFSENIINNVKKILKIVTLRFFVQHI